MSFIRVMKDKKGSDTRKNVFHKSYKGQKWFSSEGKCLS
jgi:hypothetical protein